MMQANGLPARFNIIREGAEYFLYVPQITQYQLNTYSRCHSRKLDVRMEPVARPDSPRQSIDKEFARETVLSAFEEDRILLHSRYDTEGGEVRWDFRITREGAA